MSFSLRRKYFLSKLYRCKNALKSSLCKWARSEGDLYRCFSIDLVPRKTNIFVVARNEKGEWRNVTRASGKGEKPYWRGKLSAADFHVLTSLDQLIFILKILFAFVTKQATFTRRSTLLILPLQLASHGSTNELLPLASSNFTYSLLLLSARKPSPYWHISINLNYFVKRPKNSQFRFLLNRL